MSKDILPELKRVKITVQEVEVGVIQEEHRVIQSCRDRVRKAKADLEYCIPFLASWSMKSKAQGHKDE